MNMFWDERFGTTEYAYGKGPNAFFRDQLTRLNHGRILFPAEGEGRNAVHAARLGHEVYAFDPSIEGKKKAELLASENGVEIKYSLDGYETVDYPDDFFDVVVLIFAHMPAKKRKDWHQKMFRFLKPGGTLILEGFSKEQLEYKSGGPPDRTMLFSQEELKDDFAEARFDHLGKEVVTLSEGLYHKGPASVIRAVIIK